MRQFVTEHRNSAVFLCVPYTGLQIPELVNNFAFVEVFPKKHRDFAQS